MALRALTRVAVALPRQPSVYRSFATSIKGVSEATDTDFEAKVLKAEGVVVVDFYADWCGPCRMLSPHLTQLANEPGVSVVKVNSDDNFETVEKYNISSLPTVIAFRDGKPVSKFVGYHDLNWIKDFVNKVK